MYTFPKNRFYDITSAIDYIHRHPELYLKQKEKSKFFVCPLCGSALTSNDYSYYTCIGGCFYDFDFIDIVKLLYDYDKKDNIKAIKKACEICGILLDDCSRLKLNLLDAEIKLKTFKGVSATSSAYITNYHDMAFNASAGNITKIANAHLYKIPSNVAATLDKQKKIKNK